MEIYTNYCIQKSAYTKQIWQFKLRAEFPGGEPPGCTFLKMNKENPNISLFYFN